MGKGNIGPDGVMYIVNWGGVLKWANNHLMTITHTPNINHALDRSIMVIIYGNLILSKFLIGWWFGLVTFGQIDP